MFNFVTKFLNRAYNTNLLTPGLLTDTSAIEQLRELELHQEKAAQALAGLSKLRVNMKQQQQQQQRRRSQRQRNTTQFFVHYRGPKRVAMGEYEFIVDHIVERRPVVDAASGSINGFEYRVRWEGYDSGFDSWLPEQQLHPDLVSDFVKSRRCHPNANAAGAAQMHMTTD